MPRVLKPALLSAVVVSAVVLSSCGDDNNADSVADASNAPSSDETAADQSVDDDVVTSVAPNGEELDVLALDNNFRDEEIEIVAGTTVVWENGGRNDHNIVPVDERAGWGVDIEEFRPGDVYSHAFTTPGEYPYYCTLHGTADFGMIGTVVVTG
ncbi:MAG TPA: plastocyanin/azurin family copper-binding protein [Ilumatobacteraceae bacterium]|nr:plastocyanin/azurin family copper-binding protein [Ilumatobacteraceae bacterium]